MKLYIYSLEKILFEGDAEKLTLPAEEGEITILRGHIPLVTTLSKGEIRYTNGNKKETISIESGFAHIDQKKSIVLVS
ncbi:MAG: hypothetical protein A2836_00090 [Candidatus Taylorbacteria bacterium RIFCSPHIGHO2_01_FULL_45_63]|uniref:ATP synthase F1 complex delta/epsilon subunit N-terminal domain-containing protein n=1 Tax=Candidatus Taylorbacteria bacterium RIFCSPHIGHO2_02_FULL_45_35 TaxID=1802311 RepID=A0A1G2MW84_9BACT|nr:MAG: hypothetical protein A2836_00090 [Candidatus Taylorbacteria bacterium RIFCSPHIGHO2_01_FULL_45_63]OHA27201.1 MAG: hypothetical protein A3D56_01965 [Candidatus Taylorbacteria bacterium RIFCSPHIGHO2_02_FULL_45_35]OHA33695.1 MAG: hypothetical protein A3A22_03900 [Candidatus Taylorbacteria bacterium RIFCSPLOWO2_01_FULL_45_34b]